MRAAKESLIKKNLDDYEQGKITLWQAAERCGLPLRVMVSEAKKRAIHVPYTLENLKEDVKGVRESC